MRLLFCLLTLFAFASSCNKEEKIINDGEKTLKEDFGPAPFDS